MLETKCTVSSNDVPVTPARPITKAARAAASAARVTRPIPLSSTDQENILDRSVRPPNAPCRPDISLLNDGVLVALRNRQSTSATKHLSTPVDARKGAHLFIDFNGALRDGLFLRVH